MDRGVVEGVPSEDRLAVRPAVPGGLTGSTTSTAVRD